MLLLEAQELILPYLRHEDLTSLEESHERLKFVLSEIRKSVATLKPNPLPGGLIKINDELEALFREYAQICEENLT